MPHVLDEMDHPDNWHQLARILIGRGFVRYERAPSVIRWETPAGDTIGTGYMLGVKR
jgi:hypothetical protein